jgi:hypothetical protein
LGPLHLLRFGALLTGHNLENNFVALVQRLEAIAKNRGVMDKYVLARILRNKTQALFVVPPFDFAFSHNYLLNAFEGAQPKKQRTLT